MIGENFTYDCNILKFFLKGRVDSANAQEKEQEIGAALQTGPVENLIIDCEDLEYISSAGLRVLLRLRQKFEDLKLINVSSDVYEIFEMTGFTEMLDISKAFKVISVEGKEIIGKGANGYVYRIDPDTVVKAYNNPDALDDIKRERELARTAFVLGVPTAISYDVVKLKEGGYGSVFELLDATSFAKLLIDKQKTLDEVAKMSVDLLKIIHSTEIKPGSMPSMKETALDWADFLKGYLDDAQYNKLRSLIEAVPDDNHMMHGDYHIKNVMLQNGESLLIDMDTLCHGHPVFELASMYNAYVGYRELDHQTSPSFLGIPYEDQVALWNKILPLYLDTTDEARIREVESKAMIIGYTRIFRRTIRRIGVDTEFGKKQIALCKEYLGRLLPATNTLTF